MDEVYGSRCDVSTPESTLESSLYEVLTDSQMDNSSAEVAAPPPEPAAKKKRCEILVFLKQQACNDKYAVQQLIDIEERKLEVEKQKLEEMRNLRIFLSGLINKN